jgi:hypothetical protein
MKQGMAVKQIPKTAKKGMVFMKVNFTYGTLRAELPHLNSLHEADVILGEEVRGSCHFSALKFRKFYK